MIIQREKQTQALLTEVKSAMARGDFKQASELAVRGIEDFSDIDLDKQFSTLRLEAEKKMADTLEEKQNRAKELEKQGSDFEKTGDLRSALSAFQSALELVPDSTVERRVKLLTERLTNYDTLVSNGKSLLMEGRNKRDRQKCLKAKKCFEDAQNHWTNAEIERLITEANDAAIAIKETIAVVDFRIHGDVGVRDVGTIVARLLLPEFEKKYEIVTRTQLEALLKEKNLQVTDLMVVDKDLEYGKLIPV